MTLHTAGGPEAPTHGPETALEAFLADATAALDPTYDLVYVERDDKLTAEQVGFLLADDYEALWDSTADWESENRHNGATYHATEVVSTVAADPRWVDVEVDHQAVANAFTDSIGYDVLMDRIRDRDTSKWLDDLVAGVGSIGMRQIIVNEDACWSLVPDPTATEVLARMRAHAPGSHLPRNGHNVKVVRDTLAEASTTYGTRFAMIVYAVDLSDLYKLPADAEYVDVVNPYLYLGNPFLGDGYCSDEPLHGTVRVKRANLTTDADAFGHSWNSVACPVWSYYETEVRPAPAPSDSPAEAAA